MLPSSALCENAVFEPFCLRFRPFIGERDIRKMPRRLTFGASIIANAD
jgi:hypothetical protein